jgi:ribosome-interacting GTPase 1
MGILEKIAEIEKEMARTQKNKASRISGGGHCILVLVRSQLCFVVKTLHHITSLP